LIALVATFDLMVSACRGPAIDHYVYRLWCR